jgi:hypothetical protein
MVKPEVRNALLGLSGDLDQLEKHLDPELMQAILDEIGRIATAMREANLDAIEAAKAEAKEAEEVERFKALGAELVKALGANAVTIEWPDAKLSVSRRKPKPQTGKAPEPCANEACHLCRQLAAVLDTLDLDALLG